MTIIKHFFAELNLQICGIVRFGDESVTKIEGRRTIIFTYKNGDHRALTRVYYIPHLKMSIISIGQLDETECRVGINAVVMRIFDQSQHLLTKVHRSAPHLYFIELQVGHPMCLAARTSEAAWLWHAHFGHLNFGSLQKLATQDMVRGLPLLEQVDQVCDGCLVGKQRRTPFPAQAQRRADSVLELVHGDLCCPITPTSGNKYFLLLVDDLSRYMWLRLLSSKDQASSVIKNFHAAVEVETGKKMKVMRTDHGGEFTSVEFSQYCAEHDVQCQLTAPYSPQQNRVVERRNQSIMAMARCMMKTKQLLRYFWGEAVSTVCIFSTSHQHALSIGRLLMRCGTARHRSCTTSACLVAWRMSSTHTRA
jgi:hypothetical protein